MEDGGKERERTDVLLSRPLSYLFSSKRFTLKTAEKEEEEMILYLAYVFPFSLFCKIFTCKSMS
jgi:hypothetical protein